jgi:hypothetical protein
MAIRFARQAGNWSDPLTWDDGLTIPTTGDEVYLNNYNITINQDVTTGFISNSQTPIGVPLDPIPDMTSNTSPVGVGQAFATQNSVTAWKVFRKGLNTFSPLADHWLGAVNGGQIGYQFNTPKSIQRYAWHQNTAAGSRPRDWTFQGSNDGVIWVTLHTVVAAASAATYNSPNISNPSSYTYYRINVTAVQTGGFTLWLNALSMTESTSLGNGYLSGGSATISTSRTVNADLYSGAAATFMTVSATAPSIVNITGNLPGTKVVASSRAMTVSGNCTLNFVGNIVSAAPSIGARQDVKGIVLTASATLNVTGDVYGGTNTIEGTTSSENIGIWSSNGATINVVGNVEGGTGARNRGIQMVSNDTLNVTGNVTGGVGSSTTVPIQGILLGSSTIPCTIVGNISSGVNSYGVFGSATPLRITGNLINHSSGRIAVFNVPFLFLESTNMSWEFRKYDLTTNTLYTPGVATGHPATNNVRTGVVYGPTNNLTGTCAVPPAAAVSFGVPVDNTVGTASLDANALAAALNTSLSASLPTPISASLQASLPTPISASLQASLPTPIATALNTSLSASLPAAIAPLLWDESVTNITTPNSIGERLKNCSTVATTGAQIASFNP